MRNGKRFVAAVSLAVFTLTTPLWADEAKTDQPNEENEIEFLRQEVKDLNERLARLEGLLTRMASKAESAGSTVTAHALAPGEARLINANLPPATPEPAATPEPVPQSASFEAPEGIASTGGQPLTITGILDTYYTTNFNNPADGTNTLYYTNPNSRGFGLNQAKLEIEAKGEGPIGFRSDLWFGSGARLFREGLEPGRLEDVIYLQQAYGYYQWDNGAQLDVGLFGTIAGLEVAESHLNWNYTRAILWAWNEPFSHVGAKYSAPLSDTFTGTVMLVNGFDNAWDQNSGKSYGVQGSWAPNDRFNTTLTWIHGPENNLTNVGWLKDLSWNFYAGLHEQFEIMVNFDGIWNENPDATSQRSWGIAGYARYNPHDKFRIAQRYEYFDDTEARSTGVEQILREYTLTFEYAPQPRFITRLEFRRDWATTDFFSHGHYGAFVNDQDTFTLGMMWLFGPTE